MGLKWMWAWGILMFVSIQVWSSHGCWEKERVALLQLKHFFNNPKCLQNWVKEQNSDCCQWERVKCNKSTGRVIKLSVSYTRIQYLGKWYLNASLFSAFEKLVSLDLAGNSIGGFVENEGLDRLSKLSNLEDLNLETNMFDNGILSSLVGIPSLKHLNLSANGLKEIVNISGLNSLYNLKSLDMSNNVIDKFLFPKGLIKRLKYLYLQNVSTHNGSTLMLQSLGSSPSLEDLNYNESSESKTTQDIPHFENLKHLFMDDTSLDITFLQIIRLMTSLEALSLSNCGLQHTLSHQDGGILPKFLYDMHNLQGVDVSRNNLIGKFPNWLIENNTKLEYLDLSNNKLGGCFRLPFPAHLNLTRLDISNNSFHGHISKEIGIYLPSLISLNLSRNGFDGMIPSSIGDMNSLKSLDLSFNKMSGEIPEHLAEGCTSLLLLVLSSNNFQGQIFSANFNLKNLWRLQLDGNKFTGMIPNSLANASDLVGLYLSDNKFSGSIPSWLGNMSSLVDIIMPNNHLEGTIPLELCQLNHLEVLNLAENDISGTLPSCFKNSSSITQIHLSKNRLHGQLKNAFFNSLSLVTLDVSFNRLDGSIPTWINRFSPLSYLILSNNNLEGELPSQLCRLKQLRLVDLSHNNLFGNIPLCLEETALRDTCESVNDSKSSNLMSPAMPPGGPPMRKEETIKFTTKSIYYSYQGKVLKYMSGIDLSCNKLTGLIPPQIGNLTRIHALNLSHNNLNGSIPSTLSKLHQIESLDLSFNNLNGKIPPQLVELNTLSFFSVAYNKLSGKTPETIAQFSTFGGESYEGNPLLCGKPLPKVCETNGSPSLMPRASTAGASTEGSEDSNLIDMDIFYVSLIVSFISAFVGIITVLYQNPYWCNMIISCET